MGEAPGAASGYDPVGNLNFDWSTYGKSRHSCVIAFFCHGIYSLRGRSFISPALTPIIASYFGWENALHIAAGLAIIAAILWLAINPIPEKTSKLSHSPSIDENVTN